MNFNKVAIIGLLLLCNLAKKIAIAFPSSNKEIDMFVFEEIGLKLRVAKCRLKCAQHYSREMTAAASETRIAFFNKGQDVNGDKKYAECWSLCRGVLESPKLQANLCIPSYIRSYNYGAKIQIASHSLGRKIACQEARGEGPEGYDSAYFSSAPRDVMDNRTKFTRPESRRSLRGLRRRRRRRRRHDIGPLSAPMAFKFPHRPQLTNCRLTWNKPISNAASKYHSTKKHKLTFLIWSEDRQGRLWTLGNTTNNFWDLSGSIPDLAKTDFLGLIAISQFNVIAQIKVRVTDINVSECREKSKSSDVLPSYHPWSSAKRRLKANNEGRKVGNQGQMMKSLRVLLEYLKNPPDKYFWPLVAFCLLLAAALIICLCYLCVDCVINRLIRKDRSGCGGCGRDDGFAGAAATSASSSFMDYSSSSTPAPITNDFTIFTIYDPNNESSLLTTSASGNHTSFMENTATSTGSEKTLLPQQVPTSLPRAIRI